MKSMITTSQQRGFNTVQISKYTQEQVKLLMNMIKMILHLMYLNTIWFQMKSSQSCFIVFQSRYIISYFLLPSKVSMKNVRDYVLISLFIQVQVTRTPV